MADHYRAGATAPPDDLAALGAWIDEQIRALAAHSDPAVGERLSALLDGVDALHRAALGRLAALLRSPDGAAVWARARQDPVIRAVLLLYDLAGPGEAEAPADEAREDGPDRSPRLLPLVPVGRAAAPAPGKRALPVLPAGASQAPRERWLDTIDSGQLPPGMMLGRRAGEVAVLLCNLGGELFAYEDACPDTPLALSAGHLDGEEIVCPWHGCRFDARTGRRLIHRGTGLRPFRLSVVDERIRVVGHAERGRAR